MKLKTRKEIAQEYGIHRRTLYRKLVAAGITLNKGLVSIEEQEKIYTVLGKPNGFGKKEDVRIGF